MERKENPLPQIAGEYPPAHQGNFLDGLIYTVEEKSAFDRTFPQEEIENFMKGGGDDPVEIFAALKTFHFPDIKPEAKDIVLAHFSESRFAPQINMTTGSEKEVMIYRRNIIPLLRASQEVFWEIFDLFTDEAKASLNKVFSRAKNPEKDWQK